MRLVYLSALLCGTLVHLAAVSSAALPSKTVVCYYTSWCQYYVGKGKFTPTYLDPALCTHINFAFAGLTNNRVVWVDSQVDPQTVAGIRAVVKSTGAKVMLSVGGGGFPSATFSAMARTKASRNIFIQSAIKLLRQHGLQGLDMDWEVPADWGSNYKGDKQNFVFLLNELRAAFVAEGVATKRSRLLLSAALGASLYYLPHSYDVPGITKALDIMNIMTYDYAGTWANTTGLLAPLQGPKGSQFVGSNIQSWLKAGADPKKVVMGIPTYWVSWKLQNLASHGIGATAIGPASGGPYTQSSGLLASYEAAAMPNVQKVYIAGRQAWYYVSGSTWTSGETPDTAALKGAFAKKLGLGGIMFWELPSDTFQSKKFSVIRAATKALTS